jgi:hypothetical protein
MKKLNQTIISISVAFCIVIISIGFYDLLIAKAYNQRTDADFKMMIMLMNMKPDTGTLI